MIPEISYSYRRWVLFAAGLFIAFSARAEITQKLDVVLFGQPCSLQGPMEKSVLQSIHAVSPEQALPPFENRFSTDATRASVSKLKKLTALPLALDPYKEKLLKRLEGQLLFLDALDSTKKTKSLSPLLLIVEKVEGKKRKDLEAAIKKLNPAKGGLTTTDTLDTIFETFSDAVEPDPEEIFHVTIKKLNVQYVCSFEAEIDGEDEEDSDSPKPQVKKGGSPETTPAKSGKKD